MSVIDCLPLNEPATRSAARAPVDAPQGTTDAAAPAGAARTGADRVGAGVHIVGLDRQFGDKTVLAGLDLEIPAGQFVAIVGRSGCGKSTLLRLVVGLDQPTAGDIRIGDGPGSGESPGSGEGPGAGDDKRVRIVFQEPRLLPWAKVAANVDVGLGEGRHSAERARLVDLALTEVGLRDRATEWPSVLSGGQRQRVALARALVSRPHLLALDEPLGALDALTRITMQSLVEKVWSVQRMTVILVTHDVAEAVALADRVIVLDEGRIALDVPVDLPRPRERSNPLFARIEGQLLDAIFGGTHAAD